MLVDAVSLSNYRRHSLTRGMVTLTPQSPSTCHTSSSGSSTGLERGVQAPQYRALPTTRTPGRLTGAAAVDGYRIRARLEMGLADAATAEPACSDGHLSAVPAVHRAPSVGGRMAQRHRVRHEMTRSNAAQSSRWNTNRGTMNTRAGVTACTVAVRGTSPNSAVSAKNNRSGIRRDP